MMNLIKNLTNQVSDNDKGGEIAPFKPIEFDGINKAK
jgi:hypothetical protein